MSKANTIDMVSLAKTLADGMGKAYKGITLKVDIDKEIVVSAVTDEDGINIKIETCEEYVLRTVKGK